MRRLAVAATAIGLVATPGAPAATITVTTTADTTDADGRCSLREAVTSANLDAQSSAVSGECASGSGADTITLPMGSLDVHGIGTDDNANASGDLDVTGPTTIQGAGALLTAVQADGHDRVLDVIAGGTLVITGVTITGGTALDGAPGAAHTGADGNPAADATAGPGQAGAAGGGIRSAGSLQISDSVITGNRAGDGGKGGLGTGGNGDLGTNGAGGGDGNGGSAGRGGDGGGIWSSGPLVLTRVVVTDNRAGDGGDGGTGQGGVGGLGTGGTGGTGGYGTGGLSGFGGDGGGITIAGDAAKILSSTIRSNAAGASGAGGQGKGGQGGVAGPNPSTGGVGGGATGGVAEQGGNGGGIDMSGGTLIATGNLIEGNAAGQGGAGGGATGGKGGNSNNGVGGHGGNAVAFAGADGGSTGGINLRAGTLSDSTVTTNRSAIGGTGGAATGGNGGVGTLGTGGGGNALGGDGGNGGAVGGIGANDTAIAHATITGNTIGGPASGGSATPGTGSSSGNATAGGAGSTFGGGAIFPTGSTSLTNSIVATNSLPACTTGLQDLGGNVSLGDPSCPGANVDPLLGPLADNGGPTLTRRPGDGSPAIDAAADAGCTGADQRGVARPFGARCDIGAYERAAPTVHMVTAAVVSSGTVNPNARAGTAHFEFGTTTQYGSATPPVDVPAGLDPLPLSAQLEGLTPNTTYHVRLVASNADGTSASEDATFTTGASVPGGDTTAPVFLSASVEPKTFKRRHGTTFRYKLSEAARVTFTIQRRKGKRFVKAKRFTKASKQGATKRKFVTRKLKPGRYRATLVATDAAKNHSKPKRLTFRIKR